ncbi:hypothetical protein HDU76_005742 [Blyttiomyces sp. JEL0837]|nr:hypothetical protein HDU76_005742 [Blyttiomyces sp. JEL0837]
MFTILLLFILTIAVQAQSGLSDQAAAGSDPCVASAAQAMAILNNATATSQFQVVPAPLALACYNSFAVTKPSKLTQVAQLKNYFKMYPYLDLAKNSASPNYPSQVDLFTQLDAIANDDTIQSEYVFHSKINLLVASLFDAHSFVAPSCFTTIRFLQPFVLAAKYPIDTNSKTTTPKIYIRGSVPQVSQLFSTENMQQVPSLKGIRDAFQSYFVKDLNGVDPSTFTNYTVTTINGIDAIQYIQSMADKTSGISKVPGARFNSMIASAQYNAGLFYLGDGPIYRTRLFAHDAPVNLTYGLVSMDGVQKTVVATWGSYLVTPAAIKTRDDFYQALCVVPKSGFATPALIGQVGGVGVNDNGGVGSGGTGKSGDGIGGGGGSKGGHDGGRGFIEGVQNYEMRISQEHLDALQKMDALPWERVVAANSGGVGRGRGMVDVDWKLASSHHERLMMEGGARGLNKGGNGRIQASAITNLTAPLTSDEHGAVYNLDGVNGVWSLSTFNPVTQDNATVARMISTATAGLSMLEQAGVNNLIIDLSRNGGGVICIGATFLQYLFSNPTSPPYDIRLSDTYKLLMSYADSSPSIAGETLFSSEGLVPIDTNGNPDLTQNPVSITRGGVASSYTRKFTLDCKPFVQQFQSAIPSLTKGWSSKNIFILSDGLCGSTCAYFTRVARDQFGVATLTYGGGSAASGTTPIQPSSFEGGALGSFDALLNDTTTILGTTKLTKDVAGVAATVPGAFLLPVTGSLPIWEMYSPLGKGGNDVPAEWVPEPADVMVQSVDPIDVAGLWKAAALAVSGSNPPVNNGGGGNSGGGDSGGTTKKNSAGKRVFDRTLLIFLL